MNSKRSYINKRDNLVKIGNERIELGFDINFNGALVSILDKESQYIFQKDEDSPKSLYRVALKNTERAVEWLDSKNAEIFEWKKEEKPGEKVLILETSGFLNKKIKVRIAISLRDGSSQSMWEMHVKDVEQSSVYQLICPFVSGIMKVGAQDVPGESLAVPRHGEGMVFRDPYPIVDRLPLRAGSDPDFPDVGVGEIHGRYPGEYSMQFMLYYNDMAGLYLACHDSDENVKTFDIGVIDEDYNHPVMSISHFPGEKAGEDIFFNYNSVLGVFHGDWYDGTDIYKEWAQKQWWCDKTLTERDIGQWMRDGFGVFQMSNYHTPEINMNHTLEKISDMVNQLSKEAGVPLLSLIFNFEKCGGWTGPVGFFPPREGEKAFEKAMCKLKDSGNHGFVYMPGGYWYIKLGSYIPKFDSVDIFEKEGRANAVLNASGKINIDSWYPGWESTSLCPGTEYLQTMTEELLLGCLERGCTVVQIDNIPCRSAEECYDPNHGHPLGYGPWWSHSYRKILKYVRNKAKKLNPQCAITTEGISENFIPYLDMYDQRAGNMEYFGHLYKEDPMGGDSIPLFNYVYNEYIGSYCAAYPECNRPEVLYWTRCLGKALIQGVVPTGGKYFPEPKELNPVTIGFYKKVIRATANECWKYIMFGKMLKPAVIDVPTISISYLRPDWEKDFSKIITDGRHVLKDKCIQHSKWCSKDGDIGYLFVNISEDRVEFDLEITRSDSIDKKYNIEKIVNSQRSIFLKDTQLPVLHKLSMEPLSVVVVEVKALS